MTVTNTLKSREAYEKSGFSAEQATTMGHMDEQHAGDVAAYISQVFAVDLARLESKIEVAAKQTAHDIQAARADFHSTVRNHTWAIIGFGFAIAGVAVTLATLLRR